MHNYFSIAKGFSPLNYMSEDVEEKEKDPTKEDDVEVVSADNLNKEEALKEKKDSTSEDLSELLELLVENPQLRITQPLTQQELPGDQTKGGKEAVISKAVDLSKKVKLLNDKDLQTKNNNIKYLFKLLKSFGIADNFIYGIMGNILQESNFNINAENKAEKNKFKNNSHSQGLFLWANSRNEDFYKDFNKYPHEATLDEQVKFFIKELTLRTELLKHIANKNLSIEEATDLFLRGYMNGSNSKLASKELFNKTYLDKSPNYEGTTAYDWELNTRSQKAREIKEYIEKNKLNQ